MPMDPYGTVAPISAQQLSAVTPARVLFQIWLAFVLSAMLACDSPLVGR